MKNITRRFILAAVAIPALLVFIFLIPQNHHLCLNIAILVLTVIGALETRKLFIKTDTHLNAGLVVFTAAVFPVVRYLGVAGYMPQNFIAPVIAFFLSLIIASEAFIRKEKDISTVLSRMPAYCFLLFYPGFFMGYIILFNIFPDSSILLVLFLAMVFGNDTFAYFFGMLLGKTTRGIFPVSPNKSLVGVFGGIFGSVTASLLFYSKYPGIFADRIVLAVLTGGLVSFTSVTGDLIESAMKRAANEKDSGKLMKGRGGVLDTIDSVLFSAPVFFYAMYWIEYLQR